MSEYGEIVPSTYGRAVRQPTGYGLPGYDESVFSVAAALPKLADEEWCELAGCPKRECVACKEAKR